MKKKSCHVIMIAAMLCTLAACGDNDEGSAKIDSKSPEILKDKLPVTQVAEPITEDRLEGSCSISDSHKNQVCIEFTFSGDMASNAFSSAKATPQAACNSQTNHSRGKTAIFVAGAPCKRDSAVGYCKRSKPKKREGQNSFYSAVVVFEQPFTAETARNMCETEFQGSFSVTAP